VSAPSSPALPAPAHESIEEFIFHLGLVRGLSPRTVAAYRGDLEALYRQLARRGISGPAQVTTPALRDYLIRLHEAGRQPASVARARSAIRTYFAFLLDEGVLGSDPAAELPAPSGWQRIPRALAPEEAAQLIEATAGEGPLDLRDRALLELAYGTGARVSELLGLTLGAIQWDEALLRLTGKGRRVRLVPLGRPALAALLAYSERARPQLAGRRKQAGTAPEVFLNARGGPLSRMGFWKILRKRAAAAGLGDRRVHPHLLRHSYATHLLHGGASLRVVQELLGHVRLATTQVYTSVDAAYLQSMHRRYHPRG